MPHQGLNDPVLYARLVMPRSKSTSQRVPAMPIDTAALERGLDCLAPEGCQVERPEKWTFEYETIQQAVSVLQNQLAFDQAVRISQFAGPNAAKTKNFTS
jgi:hypothetical protein